MLNVRACLMRRFIDDEKIDFSQLIISQLRWLDRIVDNEVLMQTCVKTPLLLQQKRLQCGVRFRC